MLNRRWLLYVIVLGLVARRTSSMNEQSRGKSNSPKTRATEVIFSSMNTNPEGKEKPRDDTSVKSADREDLLPSTSLNRTDAGLVPIAGSSSNDTTRLQSSHEQSHSKRHFRRSKLYRKEGRTKMRSSLTKGNDSTRSNMYPPGTPVGIPSQELFRNLTRNSDSTESLKLSESTSRTPSTSPSKPRDNFISVNSSTTSLTNNESKSAALDRKFDQLSFNTSESSGWTDDWGNSSSSSESASVVDEKISSVELMSFTFDTVEAIHRSASSTQTTVTSSSTAVHSSSPTKTTTARVSDRSIDTRRSSLFDPANTDEVDRSRSIQTGDDLMIHSVHSENNSRGATANEAATSNDSAILPSLANGHYVSKNTRNMSSTASADLERSTGEESYSSGSVNDSLDRVSLSRVIDALKNAGGSKDLLHRGSYSYTDFAKVSNGALAKRSPSLTSPEKIDDWLGDEDIDGPLKLTIPLSFGRIENVRVASSSSSVPKNAEDVPSSTRRSSGNMAHNSMHESGAGRSSAVVKNQRSASSSSVTDDRRGAQNFPYADGASIISGNIESVIRESSSESANIGAAAAEGMTTLDADGAEDFFAGFADLEIEHCNTSASPSCSFDIFIPSVNSGDVAEEFGDSPSRHEVENLTAKPESFYVLEGFRFFKNSGEAEEEEEEFDRRGAIPSEYGETESYPQIEGIISGPKLPDQIEFEAELPSKEEHPLVADFRWKGNFGERSEDIWWPNDDGERRDDGAVRRTVSNPQESPASKDVKYSTDGVQRRIRDASSYRIFLFPTVYVLIGICIVAVGCSIWWSNAPSREKRSLPKLKYFVHQQGQQRETQNSVV